MKIHFDNLFADFGHVSLNKKKESLCGDFYITEERGSDTVLVLSDGLGSGVKANILATLTAKMLCTMMIKKLPLDDAVEAIAKTLPVCRVRNMAYSTFTALKISGRQAYLAQYDNPGAILLRDGRSVEYPETSHSIKEKEIREAELTLQKDDVLILMSDGDPNAGMGKTTNGGWGREDVVRFCEQKYKKEMSAQQLAAHIASACVDLNLDETDDDITVLVIKLCERAVTNLMIGPPSQMEKDEAFLKLFFASPGKHIVCGGTTAKFVADHLGEELVSLDDTRCDEVPAMSALKGVDLVTEGLLTIRRLNIYANRYLKDGLAVLGFGRKKDAAARLLEELFENSTDIRIFFGNARNPANTELHIDAGEKLRLTYHLKDCLEKAGKKVKMKIW